MAGRRWVGRLGASAFGAAVVLYPASAAGGVSADRRPPLFAGLASAKTCVPGPVGGDRTARYRLAWPPARDNVTPSSRLVYDVYRTSAPGGERYSRPTYTTRPGATSFTTPPLSGTQQYYFVVRARDRAGNRDANRVERLGVNLCV